MTYVVTAAGKPFDLLNPDPSVIEFDDIAARLAKIQRFSGYPFELWTVAHHTLLVADIAERIIPDARWWALLHDAGEGYYGDLITPLKQAIERGGRSPSGTEMADEQLITEGVIAARVLNRIVYRVDAAIHGKAGLTFPVPPDIQTAINEADHVAYNLEVECLMPQGIAKAMRRYDVPRADRELLKKRTRVQLTDIIDALDDEFSMVTSHAARGFVPTLVELPERPLQ